MGKYLENNKLDITLESYFNKTQNVDEFYLVDENFLTFVNESAKVKEFKQFIKKLSKGEDITDAELKKFEKEITSDEFKVEAGSSYNSILAAYLTAITGYSGLIVGAAMESMPIVVASGALMYAGILIFVVKSSNEVSGGLTQAKLDMYYDRIMRIQAKAKAKLLKLENLSDLKKAEKEAKIKTLKAIISNADKLRTSYKSITRQLENKNKSTKGYSGAYKEDAEFYYVTESGDVEMIQEMKGNAVKRELLKNTLDDLDEALRLRYKYIEQVDKGLKDCISTIQKVKNKEEAAKAIIDLRKKAREFNYTNNKDERLKSKFMTDIRNDMMSFTNKYSFESVQTIKSVGSKLDKFSKNVEDIAKRYDGETGSMNKEIYNAIDKLYLSDSFGENSESMIKQFETIILSWQKALNAMAEGTIKDCNKIKNVLGLNKKGDVKVEKGIVFKLLNFKERKAAKKQEKSSVKESIDNIEFFDVDLF